MILLGYATLLMHQLLIGLANSKEAEREVGSAKTRLWLAWLAGSSLGFARGSLGDFQTLASKRVRGPSGLPPTRDELYR